MYKGGIYNDESEPNCGK